MIGRSEFCKEACYMPHLCSGAPSGCLMRAKRYYPLFADLGGKRCVVVGGGLVAQRKVTTLLEYGADVVLISPQATARLRRAAAQRRIRWRARRVRAGDLAGAWLVYAATDDRTINAQVHREARRRRVFANIVDQTPLCSFIAPAIMKRGELVVAVSTGGASPTLSKRLRRDLMEGVGVEYSSMLRLLKSLRGPAKRRLPKYGDRKRYFDQLVRGEVFELVRRGRLASARRRAQMLLASASARNGARG